MNTIINLAPHKPYALFDFDGTIADSLPVLMHIYRELMQKYQFKFFTDEEILTWRSLSARQILQRSGISVFKIIPLIKEGKDLFGQHLHLVKPVPGMPEALHHLSQTHHLAIITSNSEHNVRQFIEQHNLPEFQFIHSDKTLFSKGAVIKKSLKTYAIDPKYAFYIGDEVRDIHAAKFAKLPCLSVSWGLNSPEILSKNHPHAIVDTPEEMAEHLFRHRTT